MNPDTLQHGIRRFLKTVGVTTQRELEQVIAAAIADGRLAGTETIGVTMTLRVDALQLEHRFDDQLALE